MIIHDENASEQPSPSTKLSALPLPSTGSTTRRESSQGPAPPSYSVATSSSPTSPTDTTPLLPFAHNPHTANLTHARAANLQPQYGMHFRPTQTAGYDMYAARAAEDERIRQITRRTRRRFFKSLLIAVLIYLLVMGFIGSTVDGHFRVPTTPTPPNAPQPPIPPRKPDSPKRPDEPEYPESPKERPWPSPYDGEIIFCVAPDAWSPIPPTTFTLDGDPFIDAYNKEIIIASGDKDTDMPLSRFNSFTLPVDAVAKGIFTKGRHASGNILLRTRESEGGEDDGKIKIQMQASYAYGTALASTNVCALKKDNGWRGLGIYTSSDFDGYKDIRFSIDVLFPKSASLKSEPRPMGDFSSSLSWFTTTIYTLNDVSFDHLTLATDADKIVSYGCNANVLTASTKNCEITGEYNITDTATFSTTNAPIKVDLNMFDVDDGVGSVMSTSNGHIDANIRLYHPNSTDQVGVKGSFDVVASTKNGHVDLKFPVAPVDSIQSCTVSTANGPTNIHIHPTFEGSVTMVTSNGVNGMNGDDNDVEDPSGRGRTRLVTWDHMWKQWWLGWIGWGEKKKAGQLMVKTSNAVNILYISDMAQDS